MEQGNDDSVPAPRVCALTSEQKLLLAQEDRGKKVPPAEMQATLLERAHAGHFGETAMYNNIYHQGWWWPKMRDDIRKVVDSCVDCRKFTIFKHGYHPSQSITAAQPGDHYQIDLAQLKESAEGYTYCLVLVDVCSGFIMLRPIKEKTAETIAWELWNIFTIIGIPKILQSDNGSEFVNELIRALTKRLGVPHRFISEYNPRADGKVERVVQTIKTTVMKLLKGASVFWPLHLPFVQYAYNNKVQRLTGSTPFALMYGRMANTPDSYEHLPRSGQPLNVSAWQKKWADVLSLVFPSIAKRVSEEQQKYLSYLDAKRKLIIKDFLKTGTKIEVKDPKYLLAPRPGVEPTYIGPYFIVRQNKYGAYIVKDQHGNILDRTIPVDQIKTRLHPSPLTSEPPSSPLDAVNEAIADDKQSEEFDVDGIVDHRMEDNVIMYKVKWKGYGDIMTWEPEEHFNDRAIIEKYWRKEDVMKKLRSRAKARRVLCSGILSISSTPQQ
jgi:transposase InsO family protein